MTLLHASYPEINPRELVHYLLHESGQYNCDYVNDDDLLKMLKLDYLSFNFEQELPSETKQTIGGTHVRALLDFSKRLIATDEQLTENRRRFSVLHEIGHYVLPSHEHALYLCDEAGLGFNAQLKLESEANEFAAELLFMADRFVLEANSHPINAATVKLLGDKYQASYQATARRLVIKSFKPCMLVTFKNTPSTAKIGTDQQSLRTIYYCTPSPIFKTRFFDKISGDLPVELTNDLTQRGRDIADSITNEISINLKSKQTKFQAEYFSNTYNIFCLLTPL